MLHRAAFLAALVCLAGCGRTPSAPSEPAAARSPGLSYAGDWSGQYRFTACWAERHCSERRQQTEPFVLRLRESSVSYQGIFVTPTMVAEVRGDLDRSGALVLSGTTPAASDKDETGAIDVHRLVLTGDPLGPVTGSIAYTRTPGPLSYWVRFLEAGTLEYAADLLSISRDGNGLTSYGGQWRGEYVDRHCSSQGLTCFATDLNTLDVIDLSLVSSGSGVSAQVDIGGGRIIPVAGQVTASGVSLEGSAVPPSFGGTEFRVSVSARLDSFGRLIGTMRHTEVSGNQSKSSTADLWQVVSSRPHY